MDASLQEVEEYVIKRKESFFIAASYSNKNS